MGVKEGKKAVFVKYKGELYQGSDPDGDGDSFVRAVGGDVVEVSERKANQLIKDWPDEWERSTQKEFDEAAKSHDARVRALREQENKQVSQSDDAAKRAAAADALDDDDE